MERSGVTGANLGQQATHLVSDARELAHQWVDDGRSFVGRKALPFMLGTFIVGFIFGFSVRPGKKRRKA